MDFRTEVLSLFYDNRLRIKKTNGMKFVLTKTKIPNNQKEANSYL